MSFPIPSPVLRRARARLFAACFAAACGSAFATNYYVEQTGGNDANPGTAARPWKNLNKATAVADAGDSVLVGPGTYSDPAADPFRAFNPAHSGRAGAPIVFKSRQLHAAVLSSPNRNYPSMGVNARTYIVIDGFKVVGGIGFREYADHGEIRNCDVSVGFIQQGDVSLHWGIYLGGASDCIVENNYVHSPGSFGNKTHNTAAIMVIGVPAVCDRDIVRNNEADAGGGVWYNAFGQKAGLISNNVLSHNVARNAAAGFLGMGSTDNTKYSTGNRFQENLIVNCTSAFELDHFSKNFLIQGNTAQACKTFLYGGYRDDSQSGNSGMQVWNNIFAAPQGGSAFYRHDSKTPDWKFLVSFSDNNDVQGTVAAWNWSSGTFANLTSWKSATGMDGKSLGSDPIFTGASRGDFHLAQGSPCAHAGVDKDGTTPGYSGGAPDMGIYPRPGAAPIGYSWSPVSVNRLPPDPPVNLKAADYDPIPD
jgi:hypothetical protein